MAAVCTCCNHTAQYRHVFHGKYSQIRVLSTVYFLQEGIQLPRFFIFFLFFIFSAVHTTLREGEC